MDTALEAVNRQIQQEKDRHSMVINDIDRKKNQENTLHQQKMQQLNSRKDQIKRTVESYFNDTLRKKHATLDEMYKLIKKATEDLYR